MNSKPICFCNYCGFFFFLLNLLKGKFTTNEDSVIILFTVMNMESLVQFWSQPNISGASQQNSVAAFPITLGSWWGFVLNATVEYWKKFLKNAPSSSFRIKKEKVFSNKLGISVLVETWITPDELYEAIFFLSSRFLVLKQVPIIYSCLEYCNAVLLWSSRKVFELWNFAQVSIVIEVSR